MKIFVAVTVAGLVAAISPATAQDGGDADSAEAPTTLPAQDVLDASTPGDEALAQLSQSDLAAVADRNDKSVEQITDILANDETAWLDSQGVLLYMDPPTPAEYLDGPPAEPGPFPNSQTFLLHSRPGSSKVIYLDFDGYNLPAGTGWNGGAAYNALPYDTNGNGGTWSQSEHDTIQSVWQRISEDYAPFDVDVTTEDPGFAAINRTDAADTNYGTRLVVTNSPNLDFCAPGGCGGVAYVGVYDHFSTGTFNHAYYQPAWTFSDGAGTSAKNITAASSHEVGHNVGLSHDGQGGVGYYAGHGMWAPIMGVGYNQPVTQWSKGEYSGANQTEDDLSVMQSNGLAAVADEAPNSISPVVDLVPGATSLIGITPSPDVDTWRYVAPCAGSFTFTANPAPVSPNLSIDFSLWNWGGAFIANDIAQPVRVNDDVASGMGGTITQTLAAGSAYTLGVQPLPNGTASTGWTNYGNIGQYSVDVTTPGGCTPANNDTFATADTIGGPTDTKTGSNVGYTTETGESNPTCGDGTTDNSAWWNWTSPGNGNVTIDTLGSNFDTVLTVHTGGAVNALTEVACNDDSGGLQSSVTFAATTGTTYRIRVDGFGGASGNITLNTSGTLCNGNDDFSCADTLGGPPATVNGSNVGYSNETGEPDPACDFGSPLGPSAWWNWTAPSTGRVSMDTVGSDFDTVMAVYTGGSVGSLTEVACNDQNGLDNTSEVMFNASAGTTYRIQVYGYFGETGNIVLNSRPAPVIRPFGTVVAEGDTGSQIANLIVYLEDAAGNPYSSPTPISVDWTTVDIPSNPLVAHPGSDYVAASGVLTFAPGQTQATVPVEVLGDTVDEPPLLYGEWGLASFTGASPNATIKQNFFGLALLIIVDDD